MSQDQLFFVGQKAFIANTEGKILILHDENIGLDLPGGKVQAGETDLIASLQREVKEETQLEITVLGISQSWIFHYPMTKPSLDSRTNGALYLVGYDCSVKSGEVILSDEHTKHEWIGKEDIERIQTMDGHAPAVVAYFEHLTK